MSTLKSSAENLTLNADGSGNDIKFQSNGTEVAAIDQAGNLTLSGTVDGVDIQTLNTAVTNASNLTSGTLADARFPSTLPAISGANLTNIDAVTTGTSFPSPVSAEGSLFFKTDTDKLYVSTGSEWNLVSDNAPTTTGGTVTISALSEGSAFSYNLGIDFEDDVDTDAQLTYTLSSGTLPGGCTLPTSGNTAFTGTASEVGSNTNYTWTIKATDTAGGVATQNYQQTINNVQMTATGGTITTSGSYTIHTFTSSGTFTTNKAGTADVLVVAGGGAGGGRHGGGGGGGGVIHVTGLTAPAGANTITVGAGGSATAGSTHGGSGQNSVGLGETALGGGGGSAYGQASGLCGNQNGGSGGGEDSRYCTTGGTSTQGSPSLTYGGSGTSYGNAGGSNATGHQNAGGGGAGAGPTGSYGMHGGVGIQINIDGNNHYWSGGGGGGMYSDYTQGGNGGTGGGGGGSAYGGSASSGGGSARNSGGGGQGGTTNGTLNPGDGGTNTGGGGGGVGQNNWAHISGVVSGYGGSGIVIVRYLT
jgi:fibronectin-binding autotransporter adhesin